MNQVLAEIDRKLQAGGYKPAMRALVTALRAGRWPTALEFGALLRENGESQAYARDQVKKYQNDIAGCSSAEDTLMAQLRSFSLPGG